MAAGDVDHLDPLSAYYLPTFILEMAFTRQLVGYWPSNDKTRSITPAPDVASALPTTSNGGITNGGKTYTFHLRSGVMWNTTPLCTNSTGWPSSAWSARRNSSCRSLVIVTRMIQ